MAMTWMGGAFGPGASARATLVVIAIAPATSTDCAARAHHPLLGVTGPCASMVELTAKRRRSRAMNDLLKRTAILEPLAMGVTGHAVSGGPARPIRARPCSTSSGEYALFGHRCA